MDYRDILTDCFMQRRRTNSRYSMRAFARDILLSPSRLSEVIAGKGELSREKGALIVKQLKMSPELAEEFLDLIDAASSPIAAERKAAAERVRRRRGSSRDGHYIEESTFDLIADPMSILVWTFMLLPTYDHSVTTIAKYLKMDLFDLYDALKKLEHVNLVKNIDGLWLPTKDRFSTGDSVPSESIREFHRRLSSLGHRAIEDQTMNERHLDAAIMPFDIRKLAEVKIRIANFTQSLIDEYGVSGDSIYALSVNFFKMAGPFSSKKPLIHDDLH